MIKTLLKHLLYGAEDYKNSIMVNLKKTGQCYKNYSKIAKVLDRLLFGGALNQILVERYKQMSQNVDMPSGQWVNYNIPGCKIVNGKNSAGNNLKDVQLQVPLGMIPSFGKFGELFNLGHDLPFWIERDLEDKRIMLISQDPLRNYQEGDVLTLSTPFGMHSIDYRGNKVYTQIVDGLLNKNCSVYLTDCHKLYATKKKENPSRTPSVITCQNDAKIIRKEIEFFKPSKIVAIGKKAEILLKGMGYKKLLALPHPSATLAKSSFAPFKRKVDWYINAIMNP